MKYITTVLDLVGTALIVAGVALVFVPAAFIVAGIALVAISYGQTRPEKVHE